MRVDRPGLRVVYRYYGGENTKARPAYYSKTLALVSFLRAVDAAATSTSVLFATDGAVPPDDLALMNASGAVAAIAGGSARRSYRAAVALGAELPGRADDVVLFAEDDYLYRADALCRAVDAMAAVPGADYITLNGWESIDTSAPRTRPAARARSGAAGDPHTVRLDGVAWFRAMSTTSTFGVRRRVLREDRRVLRVCPYAGADWDYTTCLVYQGLAPFTVRELLADLAGRAPDGPTGARSVARGLARLGISVLAARRPSRRRILIGPDPELVSHMELDPESPRTAPSTRRPTAADWAAVAADTVRWAAGRGIAVPGDSPKTSVSS